MEDYRKVGKFIAAVAYDTTMEKIAQAEEAVREFEANDQKFKKIMFKYAKHCFEQSGEEKDFAYFLYKKAYEMDSSVYNDSPLFQTLCDAVTQGILTCTVQSTAGEVLEKQAGVASALATLKKMLPLSLMGPQVIAGTTLLGGAGLGALLWKLNRNIKHDDNDLEAMKATRNMYRNVSDEIRSELSRKGITDREGVAGAAKSKVDTYGRDGETSYFY